MCGFSAIRSGASTSTPAALLRGRRPRRELLDVAGDMADVVVADEALPRRHGGPKAAVADDPDEVVLRALERSKIRGGCRTRGVGAMTLGALREVGRPGGAQVRAEGRGGGGGLGERDAV